MREFVLLDSGPLGLACRRHGSPIPDQCRRWFRGSIARGVLVVVPEIAEEKLYHDNPLIKRLGEVRP